MSDALDIIYLADPLAGWHETESPPHLAGFVSFGGGAFATLFTAFSKAASESSHSSSLARALNLSGLV